MEMYSLRWALALMYILAGPFLSLLLAVVAVAFVIYGLCTRKFRRGVIANRIVLGLLIAAVLFSIVMWYELTTGRLINGEPLDYRDPDILTYKIIAWFEAFVLLTWILSTALRRLRRRE